MKKYIKPIVSNVFQDRNLIPLVTGAASLGKAFVAGVSVGLISGSRRDIYTPAITDINNQR